MDKQDAISRICNPGVIAIIRAEDSNGLVRAAHALYRAGVKAVEISLTTPGTWPAIEAIRRDLPEACLIGVGTVLDTATLDQSVSTGAQFAVSPVFKAEVVQACNGHGLPMVCGAYTPTEAWQAYECGADFIKIFPANDLGPSYMKALLAPMPQLPLVPTGGVTVENCARYFQAGCVAVAVGTSVVNQQLIRDRDWQGIRDRAEVYVNAVRQARTKS
jgi:2-dehydro-3-deoxyphosphogluconate aldolase / (4S)-4-hydroxy-2-oxoglutarate aldolase